MSHVNHNGTDIRPPRLTQHANHSVPHLPSERPYADEESDIVPPMPYDPTATLDHFSAMHISDPVPRANSSMSVRSMQSNRVVQPKHSNSLPPYGPGYDNQNGAYDRAQESSDYQTASQYSHDGYQGGYTSPDRHEPYPHQQWPPQQPAYDPLYAAASSVLGMGPPPGPPGPPAPGPTPYPQSVPPGPSYSESRGSFAGSESSLTSTQSTPLPGSSSLYTGYPSTTSFSSQHSDPQEFTPRPSMARGETAISVNPASTKSKAIDLSAPPYTKQYIDQYRQRIKADPDPEAHFLYAKYLIDAARKIHQTSKDQRAAKRYGEVLVTEALKVMRRLATQGEAYADAQFYLANCYGTGSLGLQIDHERAYHLYLQAAKQNHAAACYRVAVCNEIGAGTRREPARAGAFYRKAASLGDTAAMYKLGTLLMTGQLGEPKNPREAVGWLKRAAEQADEENPHALYELAALYENPNNGILPYDPAQAKALYTQAGHLGYTQAQYKLGQCYEYGNLTCPVDARRSIAWYTKAAEKGYAEAELALSGWYLTGSEGVLKQSDSEAYLWARRAANKGLSKAEYAVGYYAEVGIGIKQDIEFAKRWYMRAAAQGNKRAMNRLTEMKRMGNKKMNSARPTRQQAKDECVIS